MVSIDKAAMGRRIKQIRTDAGLKQWQLAEHLGTTQSAVHKYENGVVPEPRRLVKLARLGGTTVEWLLTGRHWENGDEQKERLPEEVYRIAQAAAAFKPEQLRALDEAMEVLRKAVDELATTTGKALEEVRPEDVAAVLRTFSPAAGRALAAALALHRSVVETALDVEARRFEEVSRRGGRDGREHGRRPSDPQPPSSRS